MGYKYINASILLNLVSVEVLYNWTVLKNLVNPFGIGKAIPRLCVYLTRWFITCVLPGRNIDVPKKKIMVCTVQN